MTISAENVSGLARFHKPLPVADLIASAKGLFGLGEKAITDIVTTLHKERAYFQDRYLNADKEITKIEKVLCLSNHFDADGPGDCGDRLAAAVSSLIAENDALKAKLIFMQDQAKYYTGKPVVLSGDASVIPANVIPGPPQA